MKKFLLKASMITVLLMMSLFLQGCAQEATPAAPVAPAPAATTAPAAAPAPAATPAAPSDTIETIVLYSNAISDGRGEWIQERALEELGIDVQLVSYGGVGIVNRLVAERYNPMADVVFGLNPMLWVDMEVNDLLVPYVPAWAAEVPADLNHSDGLFHAVILIANLLTYDLSQVSPEEAPTDWPDLWQDERWHGHFGYAQALTGSTTQMILAGILSRYLDPNGHLGVSPEGWAHIEGKYRYGFNLSGQDLFAEMINPDNNVSMGQMWSHGIPFREQQFGVDAGFVVPEIGVPFSIEGVALINGANNPEAAKRFIDWFGTAETMHAFSYQFEFMPAHPGALEGLRGIAVEASTIPHQDIDWPTVASHIGEWLEEIYLFYMP